MMAWVVVGGSPGLVGAGDEMEPVGATATFVIVVGHGWGLSPVGDKSRVGTIELEASIVWRGVAAKWPYLQGISYVESGRHGCWCWWWCL
jgi:hypothetical protein